MELKGKTAVITGASRGIGKAIAEALCKEGMNLCIAARGKDDVTKTAGELSKKYGVKVYPAVCDVSKQKDLEKLWAAFPQYEDGQIAEVMAMTQPQQIASILPETSSRTVSGLLGSKELHATP